MVDEFRVGARRVGHGQPCLVIGEVAQAHEGSLGMAHAFVDAIAGAGADAVKFQTHIASAESTPSEPFRVKFSPQDETRYDYWKRMEFSAEQWEGLASHARERGLAFLSSPFSLQALEVLLHLGVPAWKVASGEVGTSSLFQRMVETNLPILLSTGMSAMGEIDAAVNRIRRGRNAFAVLQCTSIYPCPPEKVGLNLLPEFRTRYHCPVGLSDHSGSLFAGLGAAALGANIIEVHVTLSREMFGPDVPVSLTTVELKQLVEGIRFIERMLSSPVDKDAVAAELQPMRQLFTKSVVAQVDLAAGTVLRAEHLAVKKPGSGIPGDRLAELIGRRLLHAVRADELLSFNDLDPC